MIKTTVWRRTSLTPWVIPSDWRVFPVANCLSPVLTLSRCTSFKTLNIEQKIFIYVCRLQQLWGAIVCTSIPSQRGSERALRAIRDIWHHQAAYQCSDLCSLKYWVLCSQVSVLSSTVDQVSQWLSPQRCWCPSPADKVRHFLLPHPEGLLAGCLGQGPLSLRSPFWHLVIPHAGKLGLLPSCLLPSVSQPCVTVPAGTASGAECASGTKWEFMF